MSIKPLSPQDIVAAKTATLPLAVIEAANKLLAMKWTGFKSTFTIEELINETIKLDSSMNKNLLIANKHLDIESTYRDLGWLVKYDSPDYTESFTPSFTFTIKK